MKIYFHHIFALALSSLLLTLSGCGGSDKSPVSSSTPTPLTIQAVLDEAVLNGIDGAFLYIEHPSSQPVSYSSGIENRITNQQASVNSLFKVASISKLFVAASAIKLVEAGIINLDDTLAFWLPEIANRIENGDVITLREMLMHRSGIPDFDSQIGFSWQNPHSSADDTLEYALDLPADFAPNLQYEYSNTNYLLIGKILDQALSYSHTIFIEEAILTPLGLVNTYSSAKQIDISLLVKGYWSNIDRSAQIYDITGGSMISTVRDIGVFLRELNSINLLFNEQEKQTYDSVYFNQHTGWLPGYQSMAQITSTNGKVIILFVNTTGNGSELLMSDIYNKIVELL